MYMCIFVYVCVYIHTEIYFHADLCVGPLFCYSKVNFSDLRVFFRIKVKPSSLNGETFDRHPRADYTLGKRHDRFHSQSLRRSSGSAAISVLVGHVVCNALPLFLFKRW